MVATITLSNILVQFPVKFQFGLVNFASLLTWGAFTYPLAFLVSDLTNRRFGPAIARLVASAGFVVAIALSVYFSTPRIAIASGLAFLTGQLLDIELFSRLRNRAWFVPPLVASFFGSALDTLIFFSLAFAPAFAGLDVWLGVADASHVLATPPLEIGPSIPAWVLLAAGDFTVKLTCAAIFLAPYRVLMGPTIART
ncbi:VUT family protein [Boseaceae bacterium BT-24-1]|nr:VUT family protein [Boseaceae bacterium BT-24-1]